MANITLSAGTARFSKALDLVRHTDRRAKLYTPVQIQLVKSPRSRQYRSKQTLTISAQAEAHEKSSYDTIEKVTADLSSCPDCKFFRVEGIIRPWRAPFVVKALSSGGIRGLTITKVLGIGAQKGQRERYQGSEFGDSDLVEKIKVEVVTTREQVDFVVRKIVSAAHTGEGGDGKIFVHPVADAVRIRTGETGASAEKMDGGRSDLLSMGTIEEA
uniref:Nitrogen regulatory protein P-II 1 n=1 Tax=Tetraselmis sp. GSL018 TaxID=582737 RepID=A0A061RWA2_9CHLO|mmetsp:Transcript_22555/g.53975  ORF Transcript_22555/g.53975 Transcript_22555/m.53975 type:complete len:215 (-) Transcript_22555:119-763(-)